MDDKKVFNVGSILLGDDLSIYKDRIEVRYGMMNSATSNKKDNPNKYYTIPESPDYVIYFSSLSDVKLKRAKNFLGIQTSGNLIFYFTDKKEKSIAIEWEQNEGAQKIVDYIKEIIKKRNS